MKKLRKKNFKDELQHTNENNKEESLFLNTSEEELNKRLIKIQRNNNIDEP